MATTRILVFSTNTISDPGIDLAAACDLFRAVLVRRLTHLGDLAANAEETGRFARLVATNRLRSSTP